MKKGTLVLMAGALLVSSLAFAAPTTMSTAQMDQVVAGSLLDNLNQIAPTLQADVADIALADNTGNANAGNLALADNDSNAVAGNENLVVDVNVGLLEVIVDTSTIQDSDVACGTAVINDVNAEVEDNSDSAINIGFDNFAAANNELEEDGVQVIGAENITVSAVDNDGSTVTFGEANAFVDNSYVKGEIADESQGVVAEVACVTDSFNFNKQELEIEAEIEDSFNTLTNDLQVCGQNDAQGIVLANSLDDQNIVANLVLTNAAANSATLGNFEGGQIPVAAAVTAGVQVGVNHTFAVGISFDSFEAIPVNNIQAY